MTEELLNCQDKLSSVEERSLLRKWGLLSDVVVEGLSLKRVHQEVNVVLFFEVAVVVYNEGVSYISGSFLVLER